MTTPPKIFSWLFRILALTAITVALLSCGSGNSSSPAKNGPKGASCTTQSSSAGQSGAQNSSGGGAASSGSGTGGGNGSNGTGGSSSTGTDASGITGSESGSLQGSGAPDCASKPDFKTNNDGGTGAGK
ncbi:MAG: hypothetical protein ABIP21_04990 [Acidimicrobiia bacterium]